MTGFARVLAVLGGVIFNVLLARYLGPGALGAFTFGIAVVLAFVSIARFGHDRLVMKHTAIAHGTPSEEALKGQVLRAVGYSMVLAGGLVVLIYVLVQLVPGDAASAQERLVLTGLAAAIPFTAAGWIVSGYFKGIRRSDLGTLMEPGGVHLVGAAILAGGIWLGLKVDLILASRAFTLSAITIAAGGLAGMLLSFSASAGRRVGIASLPAYNPATAGRFLLIDLMNYLIQPGAFIIAGLMLSEEAVGELRASERLGILIAFIVSVTNVIVLPRIARAFYEQDHAAVARQGRWASRINFTLALPIAAGVMVFPETLLSLVFGDAYRGAALYLRILGATHLISAVTGPIEAMLTMTGRENILVRINLASLIVSVSLYILLIIWFGPLGFALAYISQMAFKKTVCLFIVWRTMGVWYLPLPNPFLARRPSV